MQNYNKKSVIKFVFVKLMNSVKFLGDLILFYWFYCSVLYIIILNH